MKDFVYLDTESVSSISAQLFEGNILELINEKTKQTGDNRTDSYGSEEAKSNNVNVGLSGTGVGGNNENKTFESQSVEFFNNETFKDGVKKAYDDFLYNKVVSTLKENNKIVKEKYQLYDFVELNGEYEFYDINTIGNFFNSDVIFRLAFFDLEDLSFPKTEEINKNVNTAKNILNKRKTTKNSIFENEYEAEKYIQSYDSAKIFKALNTLTGHIKTYLKDKILLIKGNQIIIGDKSNLRVYAESLTFASSIKIIGTGRVLSNNLKVDSNKAFNNPDLLKSKVINKGLPELFISMLSPIIGLESGDFDIIHPIGLEFLKMS